MKSRLEVTGLCGKDFEPVDFKGKSNLYGLFRNNPFGVEIGTKMSLSGVEVSFQMPLFSRREMVGGVLGGESSSTSPSFCSSAFVKKSGNVGGLMAGEDGNDIDDLRNCRGPGERLPGLFNATAVSKVMDFAEHGSSLDDRIGESTGLGDGVDATLSIAGVSLQTFSSFTNFCSTKTGRTIAERSWLLSDTFSESLTSRTVSKTGCWRRSCW